MSDTEFRCPSCGRALPTSESVREAVLSHGCPVCGARVAREQFASA